MRGRARQRHVLLNPYFQYYLQDVGIQRIRITPLTQLDQAPWNGAIARRRRRISKGPTGMSTKYLQQLLRQSDSTPHRATAG